MTILMYLEWLAGFVCQIYIAHLLRRTGEHRRFTAFYRWMVFEFSKTPILFVMYHLHGRPGYFWFYQSASLISFGFEAFIIADVFMLAMFPGDSESAVSVRRQIRGIILSLGVLFAFALSFELWSGDASLAGYTVDVATAVGRLASVVLCLLFILISMVAHKVGLKWRSRVLGIARGMGVLAGGQLIFAVLVEHYGFSQLWYAHLYKASYFVAVFIWAQALRNPDPPREPITNQRILALMERMKELLAQ